MARWQITIQDPLAGLPNIVMDVPRAAYLRSQVQRVTVGDFTQQGNTLLEGTASAKRFTWEITTRLGEDDMLLFMAHVQLQQERYAAFGDGRMTMIDEVEYLPPTDAINQKPILIASDKLVFGKLTGFGVLPVFIEVAQDPNQVGIENSLNLKTITFTATELIGL